MEERIKYNGRKHQIPQKFRLIAVQPISGHFFVAVLGIGDSLTLIDLNESHILDDGTNGHHHAIHKRIDIERESTRMCGKVVITMDDVFEFFASD